MGTPRPRRAPRRATSADTAAIAALSPTIIPTDADDRAVFVIDGKDGPVAAIDLSLTSDRISIEHLVGDHLDNLGVPLWHDGTASLPQTLYFRGTWAAVALLIGFGSISIAVFIGADVELSHIVI